MQLWPQKTSKNIHRKYTSIPYIHKKYTCTSNALVPYILDSWKYSATVTTKEKGFFFLNSYVFFQYLNIKQYPCVIIMRSTINKNQYITEQISSAHIPQDCKISLNKRAMIALDRSPDYIYFHFSHISPAPWGQ